MTINNTKDYTFNNNSGYGSEVNSLGLVTLNNVIASENGWAGVKIATNGAVTITAVKAEGNVSHGFQVEAPLGLVTITNGLASSNDWWGFYIDSKGVTLRNIVANDNNSIGVNIFLEGGTALLENVTANGNDREGVYIEHKYNIITPIILRNMTAHGNNYDGIKPVDMLGAVSVTNSMTNSNTLNGLFISAKSAVTLSTIMANSNGCNGLSVEGIYTWVDAGEMTYRTAMASPTSILLTSPADPSFVNTFNSNGWLANWMWSQQHPSHYTGSGSAV